MNVIVVGAGISGLAAAWTLQRAGVKVSVLEAGPAVGGRLRSVLVDGCVMELGAQFLSTAYHVMPELAAQAGLELTPTGPGTAVLADGRLRRFRTDRAASMFADGLLRRRDAPGAAGGVVRLLSFAGRRDAADLTDWLDIDTLPAKRWSRRIFGVPVTDRLLTPAINGFYFQSLRSSGAPLAAALASFGTRPGHALTIRGGLGRLPEALASHLDVRTGIHVQSVARYGDSAIVTTAERTITADRVIVAVPGRPARAMVADATRLERDLMSTRYSRGLLVGVRVPRPLEEDELAGAYGVLVHPRESSDIAALTVASRARPRQTGRDLITVMFNDHTARALAGASDGEIMSRALRSVTRLAPTLEGMLSAGPIRRLGQAMPTVPIGHATRVAAYRKELGTSPVILAGDYLGFPWSDSAATTGIWAATRSMTPRRT